MRKFTYDMFDSISPPTLILSTKYHKHLGNIPNAQNVNCEFNMSSHQELSFDVYKEIDGVKCDLWDQIVDFKYVYVPEHGDYYELQVDVDDSDSTVKHCVGVSAGESELSQKYLRDFHVNDETDILRDDYKVTVFYNPLDPEASLLDRVLHDKAPEWSIAHVDARIAGIQRTFTTDSSTIYDFLMNTVAKEIGCLFLYDSVNRTISAYDLYNKCNDCGFRGDFVSECPKCGSTDFAKGYGTWQNVYISPENYAESITVDGDADSVKNCFKIAGGDDLITATVANINPNKSNYIYRFSEEMLNDMPANLRQKLLDYEEAYQAALPSYEAYTEAYYEAIDQELYYQTTMMPETPIPGSTTAEAQLAILMASNFTVAVQNLNVLTVSSADIAVREYAKVLIDPRYTVTVSNSSLTAIVNNQRMWSGKFTVTSLGGLNEDGEEDTATSATTKNVPIIGGEEHYEEFLEQKIEKALDRSDYALMSIFNIESDVEFRHELTLYSLDRLNSFSNTYQSVLEILIKQGVADINDPLNDSYKTALYEPMYLPYYRRKGYIDTEAKTRQGQVDAQHALVESNNKQRARIQAQLNLKKYLGDSLYQIFTLYLREDTYANSNYISDGLNNAEVIDKAKELFGVAEEELYKASELQYSLSGTLVNLMNTEEFAEFKDRFELGDWIICRADDRLYRLRLINVGYDYGSPENISVTFSNAFRMSNTINDMADLLNKADSMATSYDYVAHQASQGNKAQVSMAGFLKEGLDSTLVNVLSGENQEIVMDEHGMTIKQYIDTIEDYSPEQLKITSNILAFTKDNWATASLGLGKHNYMHYDSINDDWVVDADYGLSAMFVQAGYVSGSEIYGGQIYSTNYSASGHEGTHINLEDGSFEFAGGNFTYDGDDELKLGGFNVVTDGFQTNYITINADGEIITDYMVGQIDSTDGAEFHGEIFNTYNDGALPWATKQKVEMDDAVRHAYGNASVQVVSDQEIRFKFVNGGGFGENGFYISDPIDVSDFKYLAYEVKTGTRYSDSSTLKLGISNNPPSEYYDRWHVVWDESVSFEPSTEYKSGLDIDGHNGYKYIIVSSDNGAWNATIKNLCLTNFIGIKNRATGALSHAEGNGCIASANVSHAEGENTSAHGYASHAEGLGCSATNKAAHAEGMQTGAYDYGCHSEGVETLATNSYAHSEGYQSKAYGVASHAEGYNTVAATYCSHVEGQGCRVVSPSVEGDGYYSHAEGLNCVNQGRASHVEGDTCNIIGTADGAHAEGYCTIINYSGTGQSDGAHVEGCHSMVLAGAGAHGEGYHTVTYTEASHVEGFKCEVGEVGQGSNVATGAHAEGDRTKALDYASHSEGTQTIAYYGAHSEGNYTRALGNYSHSEGSNTQAIGIGSHSEGGYNYSNGLFSHSEGYNNVVYGEYGHVGGCGNVSQGQSQFMIGEYGIPDSVAQGETKGSHVVIVGNGTDNDHRSNAYTLDWNGNGVYAGKLTVGANPTNNMDVATKQYVDQASGASDFIGATATTDGMHGLVIQPNAGDQDKFLRGDGTWAYHEGSLDFTGATASTDGTHGLVIQPLAGDQDKYLKGDGTWTALPLMGGASSSVDGTSGLVPTPHIADKDKYLKGDGSWATIDMPSVFNGATASTAGTIGTVPAPAVGYQTRFLSGDGNWERITTLENYYTRNTRPTTANVTDYNGLTYFMATSSMTTGKPPTDCHVIHTGWDADNTGGGAQLALAHGNNPRMWLRCQTGGVSGSWTGWYMIPQIAGSSQLTGDSVVTTAASGRLTTSSVTATELEYLSGVTSSVQTQIDSKSEVSVSPIISTGTKIAEITVDGTTQDIYAPNGGGSSSVIPNPPDPPTDNLNSVSIDGTVYGILSGALYGTTSPTSQLGVNGAIYVQYSATENKIKYVYCKINGTWMLFPFGYEEDAFVDSDGNAMGTSDGDSLIFVD